MSAAHVLRIILWIVFVLGIVFGMVAILGGGDYGILRTANVSFEITSPSYSLVPASDEGSQPHLTNTKGTLELGEETNGWAVPACLLFYFGGLFVLYQLIRMVQSVIDRVPFASANVARLRIMGFLLLGWFVLNPLLGWLSYKELATEVVATGIQLNVNVLPDMNTLFVSLVLLALAEVFRQGCRVHLETTASAVETAVSTDSENPG